MEFSNVLCKKVNGKIFIFIIRIILPISIRNILYISKFPKNGSNYLCFENLYKKKNNYNFNKYLKKIRMLYNRKIFFRKSNSKV